MDIFTLMDNGTLWDSGPIINGLISKLWVERYLEPGEFEIVAPPSRTIMEQLAKGTWISHTNTKEVMVVEDHEINYDVETGSELTITGRSLDALLNYRVATGSSMGFSPALASGKASPFVWPSTTSMALAVRLIEKTLTDDVYDTDFLLPHFETVLEGTDPEVGSEEDIEIKRQNLHKEITDLLGDVYAGLRVRRQTHNIGTNLQFVVFTGEDLSDDVQFVQSSGDLTSAKYFWSIRGYYNAAYVMAEYAGKYVERGEGVTATGADKRVMGIDANDIRAKPPSEISAAGLQALLNRRGKRVISKQKREEIVEATVSPNNKFRYRFDYNMGDIVGVVGDYGLAQNLRVIEYTETDDEDGISGYPTLAKRFDY